MSRDELDIMKLIVEMSIQNTDDYIKMIDGKENDDTDRD